MRCLDRDTFWTGWVVGYVCGALIVGLLIGLT